MTSELFLTEAANVLACDVCQKTSASVDEDFENKVHSCVGNGHLVCEPCQTGEADVCQLCGSAAFANEPARKLRQMLPLRCANWGMGCQFMVSEKNTLRTFVPSNCESHS